MTWHTATVDRRDLDRLLARIRGAGGVVACCRPDCDRICVTWTTGAGDVA
ncbi:hypothetical protein ACFQ3F_24915 [Nocardioides ginsengisoli]|uniref:Uncharacterized protein n=1 Tax=Nocardioides ginsengisoli TaxID=363868 RepID=A0ABW3W9X1_9ACTN